MVSRCNVCLLVGGKSSTQVTIKKIPHTGDKDLSTDADSSTDTTVYPETQFFLKTKKEDSNPSGSVVSGWTKNTPKPELFEKQQKNHPKRKNSKTSQICQN